MLHFLKSNKYDGRKSESLTTRMGIRNESAFNGIVVDNEMKEVDVLLKLKQTMLTKLKVSMLLMDRQQHAHSRHACSWHSCRRQ